MNAKNTLRLLPLIFLAACSSSQQPNNPGPGVASFQEFQKLEANGIVNADSRFADQKDANCEGECQEMRQEFRYVVYVGKQIYAYWDEKKQDSGTDYEALAKELEASITTNTTVSEYYLVLRRWAASLHDGHVNVMANKQIGQIEIYSSQVRLDVVAPATSEEKIIVTNAKIAQSDIAPGDEVLEINGLSPKAALDEGEKMISGSTPGMRRQYATYRLIDVLGRKAGTEPLRIKYRHKDQVETVEVPRNIDLNSLVGGENADSSTGADLVKASILPGRIGYLRIDGFSGTKDKELLAGAMERLQDTDALILDVRKNGGGDQSGNVILSRLTSKKIIRYKASARVSDFLLSQRPYMFLEKYPLDQAFTPWEDLTVDSAEPVYGENKPVAVLTSPNCFSACDTFVSALQQNKLATVIGEHTGGGTGSPLVFELPGSEFLFRYSVVRGRNANDGAIEGVGTTPDIPVLATAEDHLGKTDSQLDAALSWIADKRQQSIPRLGDKVRQVLPENIFAQRTDISPTAAEEARLIQLSPADESLQ